MAFIYKGKLEPFLPRKSTNSVEKKNLVKDFYFYGIYVKSQKYRTVRPFLYQKKIYTF